jgi:hypothetical protein
MMEFLMMCLGLRWCDYCGWYRWGVKHRQRHNDLYWSCRWISVISCHGCYTDLCDHWDDIWEACNRGEHDD